MKTRMRLSCLGVVLLAVLWVFVADVAAQSASENEGRAAFRLGRAHYENGDFLKAAEQFERAYQISQKPQLLYNVYLAYRDALRSRKAAQALREYLAKAEDVPNRDQLQSRLRVLERAIAQEEAAAASQPPVEASEPPPPPEPTVQPPPEPVAQPEPEQPEPPPFEPEQAEAPEEPEAQTASLPEDTDEDNALPLTPIVLWGIGGAMVVGSVITGIVASSAQSELEDECPSRVGCDPELESTKNRGVAMAAVTDVLLFGGIAVAGIGVVLLLVGGPEEQAPDQAPMATLGCAPTGCQGSVSLSF